MAEYSRDELKRRLRERTRENEARMENPAFLARERLEKWDRIRDVLFALAIILSMILAAVLYANNYEFTTYSMDSESELAGLQAAKLYHMEKGEVLVSRDTLSFLKDGVVQWTNRISVRDPIVVSEGGYFAYCDRNSYSLTICDTGGVLTEVRLSRKIEGMDISAAGVVACITESDEAAYVSYFDRFGSRVGVEVKTILSRSGYPLNLSVSPDGQRLAVVYFSVANGIGGSRLVIYDFRNGSESADYVIAAVEDYYEKDNFLADCRFLDNDHLAAVGDSSIEFITCSGRNVERTAVNADENVKSVFPAGKGIGVIRKTYEGSEILLFDAKGNETGRFSVPAEYTEVTASKDRILFVNGSELICYNTSGRFRYRGHLVSAPVQVIFSGKNGILVNTGAKVQKITLK